MLCLVPGSPPVLVTQTRWLTRSNLSITPLLYLVRRATLYSTRSSGYAFLAHNAAADAVVIAFSNSYHGNSSELCAP